MDFIPIIPSLDPDDKLIKLVNDLIENNFKRIIIVDDGSPDKTIFNKLDEKDEESSSKEETSVSTKEGDKLE